MHPRGSRVEWSDLGQFVIDFSWQNVKFREALRYPCWALHPDVVELVAMLMLARKAYGGDEKQEKSVLISTG
ncbi:MAG: hypothetical protein ACYDHP_13495 [Ferrimicrobium sp.]